MSLLTRLFGGRIDPEAVAPAPMAAMPYSFAQFGRTLHLRLLYSPVPTASFDVAMLHRVQLRCREAEEDPRGRDLCWRAAFHRFIPLCGKVPASISGPVAVWIRDFFFRTSELPTDFVDGDDYYPLWLADDGRAEGRFLEAPAATPAKRAQQRIQFARRRGARPVRAALIQANAQLFEPGPRDLPCLVLFSFDDRVKDSQLIDLASQVFELKNTRPGDPDLNFIAGLTTDERFIYYRRDRLPRTFTSGKEVYVAHLFVHRRFLTNGYFHNNRLMTCLAEPGESGILELLPSTGET